MFDGTLSDAALNLWCRNLILSSWNTLTDDILAHNLYADNWPELTQLVWAGIGPKHSLTLKYLKAPNTDIKSFKGTLVLRVLYFVATLLCLEHFCAQQLLMEPSDSSSSDSLESDKLLLGLADDSESEELELELGLELEYLWPRRPFGHDLIDWLISSSSLASWALRLSAVRAGHSEAQPKVKLEGALEGFLLSWWATLIFLGSSLMGLIGLITSSLRFFTKDSNAARWAPTSKLGSLSCAFPQFWGSAPFDFKVDGPSPHDVNFLHSSVWFWTLLYQCESCSFWALVSCFSAWLTTVSCSVVNLSARFWTIMTLEVLVFLLSESRLLEHLWATVVHRLLLSSASLISLSKEVSSPCDSQ